MKNKLAKFTGMFTTVATIISMAVTASPALANVSTPTVTISPAVVGNNATYDVRFSVTRQLTQNGSITITLPPGTGVLEGNVTGNCTITASPGLMGEALSDANVTGLQFTGDNTSHRIIIGLNATGNKIGEGSQIRVVLGSGIIRNPTSPGSYTLAVSTSNETAGITSDVYQITLPSFQPLPGIVTGKNSAGQVLYMAITQDINGAINTTGVTTVEVTAGTYNATVFPKANQTIIAAGAAGSVILTSATPNLPAVSIMADNVTLVGFTISPAIPGGQTAVIITGDNVTVRNVTFNKGDYQLGVAAENPKTGTTIENCIFNVTDNVTIGLLALSTTLVTNCTFNVDTDSAGIVAGGNVTVTGSRFVGAGSTGAGIYVTSGTTTISSSNFNTMGNDVLAVSGNATLKVTGSTITGSGLTAASENSGVITAYGGNLILADNIIRNSSPANYALHISGGNVTASLNNITGNTLNVRQTDGLANIGHNWWGYATGPTAASMNGTVSYAPFLNAAPAPPQPPPAPNLIGPANGATAVPTNTGFSWIRITDASYDFQLSTSPTFATLTSNVSRLVSNTFGLAEPLAATAIYYWRVRATANNITGLWATAIFATAPAVGSQMYPDRGPIKVTPPSPRLTVNTTGLGFAKGAGACESGTTVTVTANPEPGWQFAGWTGDAVADAGAGITTIMMNGDKSITANFVIIPPPPGIPSGNNTSPTTPPTSLPLWPFIAVGAAVALIALILVSRRK